MRQRQNFKEANFESAKKILNISPLLFKSPTQTSKFDNKNISV